MTIKPITTDASLVIALPMNEGSGTTVYDYSGNSNDGTITGSLNWTKTNYGGTYGVLFDDDVNDYISLPNDLLISYSDGTISTWFNTTSGSADHNAILVVTDTTNGISYYIIIRHSTTGYLEIFSRSVTNRWSFSTDSVVSFNEWHHLVWVKSGTDHTLYIDGVEVAITFTETSDKGFYFDDFPVVVRYDIGSWFRATRLHAYVGTLNEFRFNNRIFSAEEAKAIYNQTYRI